MPRTRCIFFIALLGILAGCTRPPPLERLVEAETAGQFNLWYSRISRELTPEQERLFALAQTEIQLILQLKGKASGSEQVNAQLRANLHGRSLRRAINWGLNHRSQRLAANRDELGCAFKLGGDCVKMKTDSPQGAATGGGPRPVPVAGTLRRFGLHFTRRAEAEAVQGGVVRKGQGSSPILFARLALHRLRSQRNSLPV